MKFSICFFVHKDEEEVKILLKLYNFGPCKNSDEIKKLLPTFYVAPYPPTLYQVTLYMTVSSSINFPTKILFIILTHMPLFPL